MTSHAASEPAPRPPRLHVVASGGADAAARLADLEDEITSLAGHLAAGTARFLTLLSEFDAAEGWQAHGLRSCAQRLSWKCGMSLGTAREHVRVAQAMVELPHLRQAFSGGKVSFSKARAITRVATPASEAELVETAQTCTASQLDRLCSGIKRVRTNEEVLDHRSRATFTSSWRADGMLAFSGRLAPEDGAALLAALAAVKADPVRVEAAGAAGADGLPDDGYRGPGMLAARADAEALVILARHLLDNPPAEVVCEPVRLVVHVHGPAEPATAADAANGGQPARRADHAEPSENVPAGTFSDPPEGAMAGDDPLAGVLDAGPAIPLLPLSPSTLERLTCSAIIEDESNPDRATADQSRKRFANRRQRRALLRRDGGCRFAGCTRKRALHAHHVVHHSRGGLTTMANLILLCDHHHLLVHEGGWRLEQAAVGWVAVSPSGERHLDAPTTAGDTAGVLRAHDAPIHAGTATGSWAGEPLDLGYAVGAFVNRR